MAEVNVLTVLIAPYKIKTNFQKVFAIFLSVRSVTRLSMPGLRITPALG
jgi:uncharacterized membrane protein